ncbi:MAG: PEP-CTERM sorting domain-containing protein [bacterium]|nr:PEP-CTERM sorting domain-containing protein [bacterium]
MKTKIAMLLVVGMVVALAGNANAAPISLTNPSFEDDTLAGPAGSGGQYADVPTGWVEAGGSSVLVIGEDRGATPDTPYGIAMVDLYADGQQMGQSIGTGLDLHGQQIDVLYIVGRRTNDTVQPLATNHKVMIVAGGAGTFDGGVVLDTIEYSTALTATTAFNTVNLSLDASGAVGGNTQLWLVFEQDISGGQAQLMIDNVEASAIPEPATMSLLALGGLGILARRRRR